MIKRGECGLNEKSFVERYFQSIVRVLGAVALCALTAALILAFRNGKLPHSEDGNAFDTVYGYQINSEE